MANRLDLQSKFEKTLGSRNVYYQPPTSMRLSYTAIVYSKSDILVRHANDGKYSKMNCYQVTVISKRPDDPVVDKIMDYPYCSFDRHYVSDNLHHDAFTLYF